MYSNRWNLFIGVILASVLLFSGSCSLLKFNIESQSTPLGPDKLKTRMHTHNYASAFFHEVMLASDSIMNNEADRQIQLNALVWKINAANEAKNKIFQTNPEIALLDTWILTTSMTDYLKDGPGADLFGNSQIIAVEASERLLAKIDTIAVSSFKNNYEEAKTFVDSIRENEPYQSLDFYRETVYDDWYRYQNIPDSLVDATVGTLPEVLSDFSSRMTIGTEQTLRQTQWNGELLLKQSKLDSLNLQEMSDDFDKRFEELIIVLRNSGRIMQNDAVVLRMDINRFSRNLDTIIDSLFVFAKSELALMRDSLSVEREAIMLDIDKTSNKLLKTALEELRSLVKDILFYVLLILIAILFIPFALGFVTGRVIGGRKKKKKELET